MSGRHLFPPLPLAGRGDAWLVPRTSLSGVAGEGLSPRRPSEHSLPLTPSREREGGL
jgi:hypothetical protein